MEKMLMGVASASYQVEGGYNEDGKSLSIWDEFTHNGNHIIDKTNGDVACDAYHKIDEDIALLKELGVNCYRFSVSWTRILPTINGPVNQKGLDYYLDLIKKLKANNIEPLVTIYHWDLPLELQNQGGLLNKDFPRWMERLSEVVSSAFKGLVKYYVVINEPQCVIGLGHITGEQAPGLHLSRKDALLAVHNLLLAYGYSAKAIKANDQYAKVSIATTGTIFVPRDEASKESAYLKTFSIEKDYPYFSLSLYLDPICFGDYPKEYYEYFKGDLPQISQKDLFIIHQVPDFISLNNYTGQVLRDNKPVDLDKEGIKTADINWEQIVPDALYYGPKFLYQRYNLPVLISENGMCDNTPISEDGKIHDERRSEYLKGYFANLMKAKEEGVQIIGYVEWSLMDNFEWALGYTKRFGLVYVDFPNTNRIKKDSFYSFQEIIKSVI